jgi:hypothetical protein
MEDEMPRINRFSQGRITVNTPKDYMEISLAEIGHLDFEVCYEGHRYLAPPCIWAKKRNARNATGMGTASFTFSGQRLPFLRFSPMSLRNVRQICENLLNMRKLPQTTEDRKCLLHRWSTF